eukprot:jgi/Bigna1/89460/estExt_fgenesh1_pg.C_490133
MAGTGIPLRSHLSGRACPGQPCLTFAYLAILVCVATFGSSGVQNTRVMPLHSRKIGQQSRFKSPFEFRTSSNPLASQRLKSLSSPFPKEGCSRFGSPPPCRISLKEAQESGTPIGAGRKGKHKNPNRVPNHHWRAISWEDLREHPMVEQLPVPWEIEIETAENLSRLRRDSKRFLRVHHGRLTTFQLPSVLGMFESAASEYLRVPRPLAKRHDKALRAREDLRDSNAFELNRNIQSYVALAQKLFFMDEEYRNEAMDAGEPRVRGQIWSPHLNPESEFAQLFARMYTPVLKAESPAEIDPDLDLSMRFGEAQQATGVLTALNVLSKEGAVIKETGLHVLEAVPDGKEKPSFPFPIGAAPDALVKWPDGREEPLVVKTTTPFEVYKGTDGHLRTRLDRNSRPSKAVTPWHIPQMQLQMLCTGASHGWLLYMSSLNGARLYRIDRNQGYINAMAFWVNKFAQLYGSRPPPPNFFLGDFYDDYRSFLTSTKKIASKAFEHAFIKQRWVQRSPHNTPFFVGDLGESELDEGDYDDYNEELSDQFSSQKQAQIKEEDGESENVSL